MIAIHVEHKLDAGILTISRVKMEIAPDETDGDPKSAEVIQFRFECGATGAWFDADMDRDELTKLCPILGVDDELVETLNEPPNITIANQNGITITFNVAGRKQTYLVPIFLTRRTYAADKQDVMELRAENAVLRRKVASLEERVECLEDASNEHQNSISLFAAHLLTMHGAAREYVRYTKRYPYLISTDDKPTFIRGGNVSDIMEWKEGELSHELLICNITGPLIESILSMGGQRNPPMNFNTRGKLIENMSLMLQWHTNDQTTFTNGTKLIDYITDQIFVSSQPNHQSHPDHDVWIQFKKCIEVDSKYQMRSTPK